MYSEGGTKLAKLALRRILHIQPPGTVCVLRENLSKGIPRILEVLKLVARSLQLIEDEWSMRRCGAKEPGSLMSFSRSTCQQRSSGIFPIFRSGSSLSSSFWRASKSICRALLSGFQWDNGVTSCDTAASWARSFRELGIVILSVFFWDIAMREECVVR
jgi:hypothetical protein